ncbi:Pentatricopeptide repeat-containing protein [Thalictrum thalictroides]|uniref:Pentatricopeptide repeat-containing protein n=1 Tax=Thalictrum thalictroides TaxID=46969 RepID=A0A7J6WDY9_THATH|nr:Pentatricopeptide repeat-containing protein [Thalictrum thalictroides]
MIEHQQQSLWTPLERRCLFLLQRPNTKTSILQIHSFMLRNGLQTNVNLFTKFISACCSIITSGTLDPLLGIRYARNVFDYRTQRDDSFLCNSMIKAHVDKNFYRDSLTLYRDLKSKTSFVPDNYTFPSLFKSCGLDMAFNEGYQLHDQVIKLGFCFDLFTSTTLVDMYVKFGNMVLARKVFDEMPYRNQVVWTSVVVGYARNGDTCMSRELFDSMPEKDSAAYNAMIDAYVKSGNLRFARELFNEMPERNIVSWTTLIDGYCKNGDLDCARLLFDAMPEKNLVSWNAMIGGYCQNKEPRKALELFHEMQSSSVFEPDDVTVVSVLPAIADLGTLDIGEWVHSYVQWKRLDKSSNVCTALTDMFAKCGAIMKAKQVFSKITNRETASWNAMINGFAINGHCEEALEVFTVMLGEGAKPNEITMIGVLSACNHGGLVEEGKKWFKSMEGYGITPRIEHYGCMLDILGRAGCLEEAEILMENMPYEVNGIILSSFLFACGCRGDVMRAEKVMKKAFEIQPWNDGNYVMMRNLYAGKKRWTDVEEMKGLMRRHRAKKEVGCSVIEVDSIVWEFVAGDSVHPKWEFMNCVLRQLWLHMKGDVT